MLKIIMIGATLFGLYSCQSPNVKDPVWSCVVDSRFGAECGNRSLSYKDKRTNVGEWSGETDSYSIDELPPMVCIDLQDWLTVVKPTLKEGRDYWNDKRKR